ncbi:hypothetical protein QBC39DRAFT_29708 [Podospora conica]|nr:hypothetical protein QBC39DRAFT_29708 [Schizothecium conicum]
MGQFFEAIPGFIAAWALKQQVFWVATAPLSASGHVNISPKGGLYFGLLDDKTFWYMDLTGSGSETIAHLYEPGNGRITVMFNAFEGPPRILRLFGHGRVLEHATPAFDDFVKKHDVKTIPGARAIVLVDIHQVGTSCGYSVPYFDFKAYRNTLNDFFAKRVDKFVKGETNESMEKYWAFKNAWSMDGLPAMNIAQKTGREQGIAPMSKMVGRLAPQPGHYRRDGRFGAHHLFLVALLSAFLTRLALVAGTPEFQQTLSKVAEGLGF